MKLQELIDRPVGSWTGADCRGLRQQLGLTQEELAAELGYTRQGVQLIEARSEPVERVVEIALRWLAERRAGPQQSPIVQWHERAKARFVELANDKSRQAPIGVANSYRQFTYQLHVLEGSELSAPELIEVLRTADSSVRELVGSPYGFFYPYTRADIAPYFTGDVESGQGNREILECALFPDKAVLVDSMEFWRVTASGFATDIRAHWEDRSGWEQHNLSPGRWFSPFLLVRHLAELVAHAQALAANYFEVDSIEFRCEWRGLKGREVADPHPMVHWLKGKVAHADNCLTTGKWPLAKLRDDWPEIVTVLGGPVMRMFDPKFKFSVEWVKSQQPRFNW